MNTYRAQLSLLKFQISQLSPKLSPPITITIIIIEVQEDDWTELALRFHLSISHYSKCSKSQCKSCHSFFPNGPAKFDCAGECGLCDLCPFNPTIKECGTICKQGVAACTETCNKGKAICMNCKCWLWLFVWYLEKIASFWTFFTVWKNNKS